MSDNARERRGEVASLWTSTHNRFDPMRANPAQQLDHCLDLAHARPSRKLLRFPFWYAYTAALKALSWRFKRPIRATIRTFWGDRMQVVYPDQVSFTLHRYRFHDEGNTRYFLDNIRPGDIVFDIGAHMGYFSLLARHLVGPTGQVHSFEPAPRTFATLQENMGHYPNVTLNNQAVSDAPGTLRLCDYGAIAPAYNKIETAGVSYDEMLSKLPHTIREIPAVTIDDYCRSKQISPDFMKIDAEGAEAAIVRGMRQTLADHKPSLILENNYQHPDGTRDGQTIYDELTRMGYRCYEYDASSRTQVPFRGQIYDLKHDVLFVHPARESSAPARMRTPA
jgi:FkbM family methyltransferase